MLKMAKLAPILKEITKDVCVGSHDGSRSYDGKLHKTFALSPKGAARASEYHMGVRNGKTQQWRTLYVYTNVVMITASWAPYVKNYGPNIPFDYGSRIAAVWLER